MRRLTRAIAVLAVAASASLAVAPHAGAQTDADINLARTLGQQATDAYNAKDYKKAEDLFRRAHNLYKGATTLTVGLARSLAAQKKYVEAAETYNRAIREALPPNASQAFKDAQQTAQTEINDVTPKIAKVTISVSATGGGDVPNVEVKVDGEVMNNAGLGVARPIDPGAHQVTASAAGFKAAEKSFTVTEGQATDAPLQMDRDGGAVVAPTASATSTGTGIINPPPPPPGGEEHHGGSKVPAFVAFGVGGVGLVVGGIFGGLALGNHSDIATKCPTGTCDKQFQGDVDSYHTNGLVSTAGFIVGGVGVAAGVVLWLTAGSSSPAPQKASVTPYVGLGSVGAVGRF